MTIRSFTIYNIIKRNACLYENRVAVEDGDRSITFYELWEKVRALGNGLKAQGVGKGDVIAVLSRNSDRFFLLYGAAAYIGAIIVPINWRLSIDEIQYILSDSNPKMVFVESEVEELVGQLIGRGLSVLTLILLDKAKEGALSFSSLMEDRDSFIEEDQVKGSDPYIICYTAAIQGRPRGAVLSHDNIVSSNIQTALQIGLTCDDAYLNILPVYHMIGLAVAMSVMHVGGKNTILSKFDPPSVLKTIGQKKISIIGSFPPILSKLLSELMREKEDISSLKHVYGIESPSVIKDFEKASNSQFWCLYGQTESMLSCLCPSAEKTGSAGRPGVFVDLIIGDEDDRQLPPGEIGEILIRGPLVFIGYWNQPELSKFTLRNDWHHTGDIGHLDADGYLWFKGRKAEKDLIKSGGENIYPVEVEKVLLEHPDVKETVVFGVPDEEYGEGIKAICVLGESSGLSEQQLADFVAHRIAKYKRPKYIMFVSSLPRGKDGSVDRKMVKAEFSTEN